MDHVEQAPRGVRPRDRGHHAQRRTEKQARPGEEHSRGHDRCGGQRCELQHLGARLQLRRVLEVCLSGDQLRVLRAQRRGLLEELCVAGAVENARRVQGKLRPLRLDHVDLVGQVFQLRADLVDLGVVSLAVARFRARDVGRDVRVGHLLRDQRIVGAHDDSDHVGLRLLFDPYCCREHRTTRARHLLDHPIGDRRTLQAGDLTRDESIGIRRVGHSGRRRPRLDQQLGACLVLRLLRARQRGAADQPDQHHEHDEPQPPPKGGDDERQLHGNTLPGHGRSLLVPRRRRRPRPEVQQ